MNLSIKELVKDESRRFALKFVYGDDTAILEAIHAAGIMGEVAPAWAIKELGARLVKFNLTRDSLDEVFEFKPLKLTKEEIRIKLYGHFIYTRIEQERAKGFANNHDLWERIGKECIKANSNILGRKEQLGAYIIRDVYFAMLEMAKTKNIPIKT